MVPAPPTTAGEPDTGDLVDPEVRSVTVDGLPFLVAWADTPETRSRGLMEVTELGDLDGMLFDLGTPRAVNFHMLNTLIPLDIVFFDELGRGREMLTMEPCPSEPCPVYPSGVPVRFALEVPAGSTKLTATSVLELP